MLGIPTRLCSPVTVSLWVPLPPLTRPWDPVPLPPPPFLTNASAAFCLCDRIHPLSSALPSPSLKGLSSLRTILPLSSPSLSRPHSSDGPHSAHALIRLSSSILQNYSSSQGPSHVHCDPTEDKRAKVVLVFPMTIRGGSEHGANRAAARGDHEHLKK